MRKTIQRKLLTVIQLQTILKEVEATVNARPIVYLTRAQRCVYALAELNVFKVIYL